MRGKRALWMMCLILMLVFSAAIVNVAGLEHDVAITGLTVSPTVLTRPDVFAYVNVTVENPGTSTETFNVTTFYWGDATSLTDEIGNQTVVDLASEETALLEYTWDTTGLPGDKYWIWAESYLTGDQNTTNDVWDMGDTITIITTKVFVDPSTNVYEPGEYFTVDINIADVTGLNAWEVKLSWDSYILYTDKTMITEGPFLKSAGPTSFTSSVFVQTALMSSVGLTPEVIASGSGTLANVTFHVVQTGKCKLHLSETSLFDVGLASIPHGVEDGVFYTMSPVADFIYYTDAHPPPIPGQQPPAFEPVVGEIITFNATYEPATMTGSYDPDGGTIISYEWNFGDDNIATVTDPFITHVYTAVGDYSVNLTVTDDTDRTDSDQESIKVVIRDIAITSVKAIPTAIRPGQEPFPIITVTIANEGTLAEYFNVTVYYDDNAIWYNQTEGKRAYSLPLEIDPVTKGQASKLDPGENLTVTFTWNTTGVVEDTYTIQANASLVDSYGEFDPGIVEIDIVDNTKTIDVFVTMGAPLADFTFSPEDPMVNETVFFDSSASSDLSPGWIVSYTWDFGDDTIITVDNVTTTVTHSYGSAGTYVVTLNVTDNDGLVATAIKSIKVSVHDIAVTAITVTPTTVKAGENITIYVTVGNEGEFDETFDVTLHYDDTVIGTQTGITLKAGTTTKPALKFTWNTTGLSKGEYTISAEASVLPDETNTANNKLEYYKKVAITVHDIAVTAITVTPTTVKAGENITISVTVTNEGSYNETFSVTLYYDDNVIETRMGISLEAGANVTLTFAWNTTGVPLSTYTISAGASEVPEEIDTVNNAKIYGTMTIEKLSSNISATLSLTTITVGKSVSINGSITPSRSGVDVTIWYKLIGDEAWNNLTTVQTDQNSQYSYTWTPQQTGTYEIKASWPGDSISETAESATQTLTVQEVQPIRWELYAVVGITIVSAAAMIIYFTKIRKPKPA